MLLQGSVRVEERQVLGPPVWWQNCLRAPQYVTEPVAASGPSPVKWG